MPLTFPTEAEKALAEFRAPENVKSLATIATRRGAETASQYPGVIIYIFEDNTALEVTKRAGQVIYKTFLP